ncbi:hypothetical protein AM2_115 [Lactococcus phage AM2]|uniref:DUF2726 domain-containing protein n=7 Tax=Audreyjarvisvirus AM1 TaxID=2845188 RepID=A0A1X9SHY9_9CAUD|nr:HNH endonuclease [Lactococcus phage AM1]ARM66420.1 hypothetical protein AM2_115 [Lactococcus phage AM2]ARM66597.1 hypothetical protein AM3_115 [Lactococcus phage AM3]ARM67329.1 hypothetical protein AM9_116 [Lactococcus phage AM9]ARQ95695.1 hypothetical protein AM12_116 [Lactococcus phage AM12]ARM66243.1 hypothetical protein AM1_116 [Lactococcus phage AM1]
MRKLTNEEVDVRIKELIGDEYTRLGDYQGNHIKILVRHNTCGNEYEVTWNHFKGGNRCPRCSGKEKLNSEMIDKKIFELTKNKYIRLSEYQGAHIKMLIKHSICGNEYRVTWGHFQQGNRCPKCQGNEKLDNKKVDERIFELTKNEYIRLNNYQNAFTKILIRHNTCGNEYLVTWNNFKGGSRCPRCSGLEKLDNKKVDERIKELVKDEYIRLGNYRNNNTKILVRHNVCGNEYLVTWGNLQSGQRCPRCSESKGEKRISNLLESLNIKHTAQKRFPECKHKKTLPFDFYIHNKNTKLLIEFDGMQHYEPIKHFGGEKAFKETQLRDSIKNKFAQDNNIPLLRISYLEEEDVENIVMNKLKELNFIK